MSCSKQEVLTPTINGDGVIKTATFRMTLDKTSVIDDMRLEFTVDCNVPDLKWWKLIDHVDYIGTERHHMPNIGLHDIRDESKTRMYLDTQTTTITMPLTHPFAGIVSGEIVVAVQYRPLRITEFPIKSMELYVEHHPTAFMANKTLRRVVEIRNVPIDRLKCSTCYKNPINLELSKCEELYVGIVAAGTNTIAGKTDSRPLRYIDVHHQGGMSATYRQLKAYALPERTLDLIENGMRIKEQCKMEPPATDAEYAELVDRVELPDGGFYYRLRVPELWVNDRVAILTDGFTNYGECDMFCIAVGCVERDYVPYVPQVQSDTVDVSKLSVSEGVPREDVMPKILDVERKIAELEVEKFRLFNSVH